MGFPCGVERAAASQSAFRWRSSLGADQALLGDQSLERAEPVVVVGVSPVGVAGGLGALDLPG